MLSLLRLQLFSKEGTMSEPAFLYDCSSRFFLIRASMSDGRDEPLLSAPGLSQGGK
jgi:hypothetical protein